MPTANAGNSFSRGYEKLRAAARGFSYDFRGKTVLDIGSSTGGFTKYALDAGAKKVIAVEKGTNQMKAPLRFDPRVELHEKTDILEVSTRDIIFSETLKAVRPSLCSEKMSSHIDTILADVSFISLTKILKCATMGLARSNTDYFVMLKPQFEARPEQMTRGVVKNEKIRREIIKNFEFWLKQNGFLIVKKRDNELRGKNGNKERFYWLKSLDI